MAGAEGVIHVGVGQRGQIPAELRQVLGLLLAETGVLQQHHIAVLHGGDSGLGVVAHDGVVIGKHNVLAQLGGQGHGNGGQAELGLGAVLGLAQMAAQDDLRAIVDELLDGGQRRIDAVLVGDDALLHGDVEIAAHQHALAGVVLIVDGLFTQTHSEKLPSVLLNLFVPPRPLLRRGVLAYPYYSGKPPFMQGDFDIFLTRILSTLFCKVCLTNYAKRAMLKMQSRLCKRSAL